jgi:hypothetical protein
MLAAPRGRESYTAPDPQDVFGSDSAFTPAEMPAEEEGEAKTPTTKEES